MGLEIKKANDTNISVTISHAGVVHPRDDNGFSFKVNKVATTVGVQTVELGRIIMLADTSALVKVFVFARGVGNAGKASWDITALVDADSNLNRTVIGQTVSKLNNATADTWALAVDVASTADAVVLNGTGGSGQTIDWGFVTIASSVFSNLTEL